MARSRRNRRGRTTTREPAANNDFLSALRRVHQARGALGVIEALAYMFGKGAPSEDRRKLSTDAMAQFEGRLGAMALAAIGFLSPDEAERSAASALVEPRRSQLPGLFQRLDQTVLGETLIVSDEFGDIEFVLIELRLGGRRPVTLLAVDDLLWGRRTLDVAYFRATTKETLERTNLMECPGAARSVTRVPSLGELSRRVWHLHNRPRVAEHCEIGVALLALTARLLDVNVAWPNIPFDKFDRGDSADGDEEPLIDRFRRSSFAADWARWEVFDLVDHLVWYSCSNPHRNPLQWSPGRVEHFLHTGTETDDVDLSLIAMFPALLRAWVRFAAAETGQRKPLLRMVLQAIDDQESSYLASLAASDAA